MDSPSIYEDEVVADSEDEGSGLMIPVANSDARALLQDKIPPGITQDTILSAIDNSRTKPLPISSISDPTTSSSVLIPRPKPRPRHKEDTIDATSSSNIPPPSNSVFSSDIHMDMDFTASNIADRAKTRSRNTKSQTQRSTSIVSTSEIIELSSDDEDDFNLLPSYKVRRKATNKPRPKAKATVQSKSPSGDMIIPNLKPRPRPRAVGKQKQGKSSDPTSPLSGLISQEINPIPTSSISNGQYPIPFKLLPSQLPPSDPPTSTATTYDHPPIVTLPQVDTDQDPLSSPSSLFSVYSNGKKKRKRNMSSVDELDSDQGPVIGSGMNADRQCMPPPPPLPGPPPTFFAGSSSSPAEFNDHVASRSTNINTSAKKTSAPKKLYKKVVETEDDEDTSWSASKLQAKSKPIPSAKKVEVVIERSKGKGKGKEKEKEVFKSREFIDDDDDAMDLSLTKETGVPKKPDSLTSLSSIPDSDLEDARKCGPSRKRKSVDRDLTSEDAKGEDWYQSEPKRRAMTQGKERRLVVSDDEGEELQDPAEPASSKQAPAKSGKKGKGKEKRAKAKRMPKSTTFANDDFEASTEQTKETEESPSASFKENIEPASDMNVHTPSSSKPPAKPEPSFPSLSSRYTIAPKTKSTPMSDLIRRVNSKPGSPFCSPAPGGPGSTRPSIPGTAYSPYIKASRSALSRIAPLHPNRRTPPPPLPPPPPKKKTKKELEREEQWEEDLVESVGGITIWACMSDAERNEMRKAKRERDRYGWED